MNKNGQEYKDKSRERLKKIMDKKFLTTTIYPLSQFEEMFGSLWGHGKPEKALTEEEIEFRDKWEVCRNRILNNGNQQRRNAMAELDMNEVTWLRYTTVFKPIKPQEQMEIHNV